MSQKALLKVVELLTSQLVGGEKITHEVLSRENIQIRVKKGNMNYLMGKIGGNPEVIEIKK